MFSLRARTVFATALVAALLPVAPAHAEDGAWRVGSSYVVRFETLDLSNPADRAVLLSQIERSAAKLCEGVRSRGKQRACAAEAVKSATAKSPHLAATVQLARLERDKQQQAQR